MNTIGPRRVVVMGVTSSGKTSVGIAVAERLGLEFRDSDDLHPQGNVDKMSRGEPLTDEDRAPWLDRVGEALAGSQGLVIACSSLKRAYRDRIRAAAPDAVFLHLEGSRELLERRMKARKGHFMPVSLLDSQLETLEEPGPDEPVVTVSIEPPVPVIADEGTRALRMRFGAAETDG